MEMDSKQRRLGRPAPPAGQVTVMASGTIYIPANTWATTFRGAEYCEVEKNGQSVTLKLRSKPVVKLTETKKGARQMVVPGLRLKRGFRVQVSEADGVLRFELPEEVIACE